jgi:predicted DNA-binding protein
MGRPPLNVKPTVVRLTEDVRQRIVALVGENRMAAFIREAIEAELKRRERASEKSSKNSGSSSAKTSD